jgi:DNA-3-methyladenine glycosylase
MVSSSINSSRSVLAKVLPASFYARNTLEVARELLGKVLVVRTRTGTTSGRIIETEAYREGDPASHSSRGETPRSAVMFGPPGIAYVYFIYGMYEMLNFVTEPKGDAGAVLIRSVEPLDEASERIMRRRRELGRAEQAKPMRRFDLTAGPGKLCRAMGIKMSHNGVKLSGPAIQVVDDGFVAESVSVSPRVGITAGTDQIWRFFITAHPFLSRAPQNAQARPLRRRK